MSTSQDQPSNPSLPSPPFHHIPNLTNLRDAAHSLTTTSGAPLRPGILFRSADPSKLDADGWHTLQGLRVGWIFDLRSAPELTKVWATEGEDKKAQWEANMKSVGVQRRWVPVFEEKDYSPERLAERYVQYMSETTDGFVGAYQDLLGSAGGAFRTILLYLAGLSPSDSSSSSSVLGKGAAEGALIHCTAGKDRTGIFFGLLFSFLGVPRAQIAEEYNLTEQGLAPLRDEIVERLLLSPGFRDYMAAQSKEGLRNGEIPPEILAKGRAAALRMISARKESMLGALDMVDEVFGGAEAYFRKACGLDEGQLDALRRNLVSSGGGR